MSFKYKFYKAQQLNNVVEATQRINQSSLVSRLNAVKFSAVCVFDFLEKFCNLFISDIDSCTVLTLLLFSRANSPYIFAIFKSTS